MEKKHRTIREKLEEMKQTEQRNEQHRKEYADKKKREEKLLDLYLEGRISKEELYRRIKQ